MAQIQFSPSMRYQVVVLQVDDTVKRRDPSKPCLHVGIRKVSDTVSGSSDGLPEWVRQANPIERRDLAPTAFFLKAENARRKKTRLMNQLGAQGYTINQITTVYRLYVIELNPDPAKDGDAKAVYVGETSKSVDERFQQHLCGGMRASPHVVKRGVRILSNLTPRQLYFSREESKAAEARLAERLRKRGYAVYGGH